MAIFDNWRERRQRRRDDRFIEDIQDVLQAARALAVKGDTIDTLKEKIKAEFDAGSIDWDKLFQLIEKILALILALV